MTKEMEPALVAKELGADYASVEDMEEVFKVMADYDLVIACGERNGRPIYKPGLDLSRGTCVAVALYAYDTRLSEAYDMEEAIANARDNLLATRVEHSPQPSHASATA
jgi:hypothetical protein